MKYGLAIDRKNKLYSWENFINGEDVVDAKETMIIKEINNDRKIKAYYPCAGWDFFIAIMRKRRKHNKCNAKNLSIINL